MWSLLFEKHWVQNTNTRVRMDYRSRFLVACQNPLIFQRGPSQMICATERNPIPWSQINWEKGVTDHINEVSELLQIRYSRMFRRGTDHSIVVFEDRSGESVFGRSTDHFSKVGFEYRSRKQGFVRTTDHIWGVARQKPLCNPEGSDTLQISGGVSCFPSRSLQISPDPS